MRIRSSNFRQYNIPVISNFEETSMLIFVYLWISLQIKWEKVNVLSNNVKKYLGELSKNLGESSKKLGWVDLKLGWVIQEFGWVDQFFLGELVFGWVVLIPNTMARQQIGLITLIKYVHPKSWHKASGVYYHIKVQNQMSTSFGFRRTLN